MGSPIILALDTKDLTEAQNWIEISLPKIDHFKVGLEFFDWIWCCFALLLVVFVFF